MVQDFTRNRDLYARVGADYSWIDRLGWNDRQWRAWADRVETHMVELRGKAIGYFELEPEPSSTKIAIFGLLGGYHGRGLGGHALTVALRRGFELKPRVWLTTCSLDSPAALPELPRPRPRGVQGRGAAVVSAGSVSRRLIDRYTCARRRANSGSSFVWT